uniref:Uncharacterized protein n=1 Tax=Loxodonta africana TaxID=9785 RepID=G3U9B8_LOXAF
AERLEEAIEDISVNREERWLKRCAHGNLEDRKSVTHHKLVPAGPERVLDDTKAILEEGVSHKDEQVPVPLPQMADVSEKKEDPKAPERAISRAAANPPSYDTDRAVVQTNTRDFQTELRKMLVAFMEVAQKLPVLNPDASELFKKANAMLDDDEEERADDSGSRVASGARGRRGTNTRARWDECGAEARADPTEVFKKMGRKREFPADAQALFPNGDGFDEKEVIAALRVNNPQKAACEWLLGDRKPSPKLDRHRDPQPLFPAILGNPVVRLGTDLKTVLAFEDVLENSLNGTPWMSDLERPVMLQISRIFQTLSHK